MLLMPYCIVLYILLICISCSPSPPPPPSNQNELHISVKYNPITLDPRKNADPVSCSIINLLYEGLTHLEADGSISLSLAESIKISKNHTKYTFHLKEAKWSNGEPITSYDFEASWKKILSPSFNALNAYFLYPIKNARLAKLGLISLDEIGIYVENNKTFHVRLEQPNTYFLKILAFPTCFPVWKGLEESKEKESYIPSVFSGAFTLDQWHQNDFLTFKKNPSFWNASEINLNSILISVISDKMTSFHLYERNQLDCIGSVTCPIPEDLFPLINTSKETTTIDQAGTTLCFFNIHCFPFNNINIRKAFYYAIDKQDIINYISQNQEKKAYGLVPPILKNNKTTKFTPDGSKELAQHHFSLGLKELGISAVEFPHLTFCFFTDHLEKTIATTLQEQWKNTLGVSVNLEGLDIKIFLDKLYKKNYQFCLMSILAQYFDPMNFLERFLYTDEIKNFCSWENEEFKHLINISFDTLCVDERLAILEAAEAILMSEIPAAPIYHHRITYLSHPYLKGVQINPIGLIDLRKTFFSKK